MGYLLILCWAAYLVFAGPFLISQPSWESVATGVVTMAVLVFWTVNFFKRRIK